MVKKKKNDDHVVYSYTYELKIFNYIFFNSSLYFVNKYALWILILYTL